MGGREEGDEGGRCWRGGGRSGCECHGRWVGIAFMQVCVCGDWGLAFVGGGEGIGGCGVWRVAGRTFDEMELVG